MANLLRFGRRPLKATLKDTDENAAKYEAALFDKDGCQFLRYVGQGRKPVEVRAHIRVQYQVPHVFDAISGQVVMTCSPDTFEISCAQARMKPLVSMS